MTGQAAPITLNFWDMQWGVSEYAVAAQKLVDRYNQEHSDNQVIYRPLRVPASRLSLFSPFSLRTMSFSSLMSF